MTKTEELLTLIATMFLTLLEFKYLGLGGHLSAQRRIDSFWSTLKSIAEK